MKTKLYIVVIAVFLLASSIYSQYLIIADHTIAKLSILPDNWIDSAKAKLHIAYGHTSHGSQLITGMTGLENWKGSQYAFNEGGLNGALDIDDNAFPGASDLGNPDRTAWETATRNYLNNPSNNDVNVVIWSWCGQVSSATESDINTYLSLMNGLENDYPGVKFVYMTGHLDGTGLNGNLNQRNEQIRNYCLTNGKILYDFADIESYDPEGIYYLDKDANDNCDYDSDGNGSLDKNWAVDWQNSHILNVDWFNCSAAHSQPLNGNLKAYAAWWLWAKLAGWDSAIGSGNSIFFTPEYFILYQNFPNPFNSGTVIKWFNKLDAWQSLIVYDALGNKVSTILNEFKSAGEQSYRVDLSDLPSGIYFYKLTVNNKNSDLKKMILLK